jgi:ABC-type multidrug transport system ATPase subunit
LPEVEALCSRVVILMNGQIREDARLAELASSTDVILVLERKVEGAANALKGLTGVSKVETTPTTNGYAAYRIVGQDNSDLCPAIFQLASQQQWPVRELRSDRQTLESVFNKLAA